jgi:hypothetical protein
MIDGTAGTELPDRGKKNSYGISDEMINRDQLFEKQVGVVQSVQ